MTEHSFIFHPGTWLGQGTLSFSYSPEQIPFYAKWIIDSPVEGVIRALQQVVKQGEKEPILNTFLFSPLDDKTFSVVLNTELIGSVRGEGKIEHHIIAWEFQRSVIAEGTEIFEGFEVYELQDSGEYRFHAEYSSTEQFRTIVDGKIWKKYSNKE